MRVRVRHRVLFTGNPSVYSIQDLRCQVARGRGLADAESRPQYEPVLKLSRAKKQRLRRGHAEQPQRRSSLRS